MRTMAAVVAVMIGAGLCGVALGVGAEIDMGGIKDARADLDAGHYGDCLHKLARLLAHTSALEKTKERGLLLSMRGECLLQQKQANAAADTFDGAAVSYPASFKKEIGQARITSELIRASVNFQYIPKTGADKTPLPIIDLKTRPAAFAALFRDKLAADQDTIKTLTQASVTVQNIIDFVPEFVELATLENAGTGAGTQTTALAKNLTDSAKKNMDDWLETSSKEVGTLSTDATRNITTSTGSGSNRRETTKLRGITEGERTNLNKLLATAEKIPAAVKTLADSLAADADSFKKEADDAKTLATKVQTLLKTAK